MADHDRTSEPPDDPFLERRLATLAVLPVAARPSIAALAERPVEDDEVAVPRSTGAGHRRSHRSWLLAGAAAAALLVLVSVAAVVRSQDAEIAATTTTELAGLEYWSTSVTEAGVDRPIEVVGAPPGSARIKLEFEADRIVATATCNTLNAAYTVEGDRLVLGEVGSTQANCVSPLWEQDDWLRGFLTSAPTLRLEGHRLTLTSGDTVIELVVREVADPNRSLAGTRWRPVQIVDGPSVASVPPSLAFVELTDRGTTITGAIVYGAVGHDGCNGFGGTIEVVGDRFGAFALESTLMGCPESHRDAMAVLGPGATFRIEGAELTVTAADGARSVIFQGFGPAIVDPGPEPEPEPERPPGTDAPGTTVASDRPPGD
jgi:heat shock protein HslJ